MKVRIFQKGFNYSQDGPGNRLVYHMQGCNMMCPWCANPEGLLIGEGQEYSAKELVEEVLRSRSIFFDGGGVTFTGGEPTLQFNSLMDMLVILKQQGIHTAVETNGTHPHLDQLFPWIDYLMVDYKQPVGEKHKVITGIDVRKIEQNIQKACERRAQILVRIPFVNGYNTALEDMEAFVEKLGVFQGRNLAIEVLPYHEYGKVKWEQKGWPYAVENGHVEKEKYQDFISILKQKGLSILRT